MTLELALKRQGCLTCASRIRELGGLATCLFWSSGYFGSTRLPRTGCEHWRMRGSVDATPEGAACTEGETGAIMQNGEPQSPPSRIADGVASAGLDLTTSGVEDRDG